MHDLLYDRIYWFLSDRQKRAVETIDQLALGSIVGSVRNRNEDVAIIVSTKHASSPQKDYTLGLVCDGMGGMADGRQAALIAASTFVSRLLQAGRFESPEQRLKQALAAAQFEVFEEFRGAGGTTLSAIYLGRDAQSWLAHVGDSRIYSINAGVLRQLSRDDTIGAALNRENENRVDANRLIQFIGVDGGDLEPQVISVNRNDCDGFLLTSDGAHGAGAEILSTVARHARNGPELVRKLLNVADAVGGLDNATAVYVPASDGSKSLDRSYDGEREGILTTILCASGQHDIWITQVGGHGAPIAQRETPPPSDERSPDKRKGNAPQAKVKGTKKRKSAKSKPETQPNDELPLVIEKPVAKLDFSDDDGGKS